jgi:hypothetical protein
MQMFPISYHQPLTHDSNQEVLAHDDNKVFPTIIVSKINTYPNDKAHHVRKCYNEHLGKL